MESVHYKSDPCTLVIMAKAPQAGMVKTRLARNLPEMAVTDLYRCLLDDTINLAKGLDGVDVAMVCPQRDVEDLAGATSNRVRVVPQSGKGLAAGLTSVFAHFSSAGARRIVAFNSDTPHLAASVAARCVFLIGRMRCGSRADSRWWLLSCWRDGLASRAIFWRCDGNNECIRRIASVEAPYF
jgi:glycosyltransferase A (GT-A) superfamily protein (DUF2064 family)